LGWSVPFVCVTMVCVVIGGVIRVVMGVGYVTRILRIIGRLRVLIERGWMAVEGVVEAWIGRCVGWWGCICYVSITFQAVSEKDQFDLRSVGFVRMCIWCRCDCWSSVIPPIGRMSCLCSIPSPLPSFFPFFLLKQRHHTTNPTTTASAKAPPAAPPAIAATGVFSPA
jgi:hypothetical protein